MTDAAIVALNCVESAHSREQQIVGIQIRCYSCGMYRNFNKDIHNYKRTSEQAGERERPKYTYIHTQRS